METPIEILKERLNTMRYIAANRRLSSKKREAKQMIPQFEQAINILESALAENTPTSSEQCATPAVVKSVCDFCDDTYRVEEHPLCERCRKILGD